MQRAKSDSLLLQEFAIDAEAKASFGPPSDHQERIYLCDVDFVARVGILFKSDQQKTPEGLRRILHAAVESFKCR